MRALMLAMVLLAGPAGPALAMDRAPACSLDVFKQQVRDEYDSLRAAVDDPSKIVLTPRDGRIVVIDLPKLDQFLRLGAAGVISEPAHLSSLRLLYPDEFELLDTLNMSFTDLARDHGRLILTDRSLLIDGVRSKRTSTLSRIDSLNGLITAIDQVCAEEASAKAAGAAGAAGVWRTTYGEMTIRPDGGGTYSEDGGRIEGRLTGLHYSGYWGENSSARLCATERMGTRYWGRLELDFNAEFNAFTGAYSYCDEAVTSSATWNGTLIPPS